jgi:hypothetical protein
VGDTDFKLWSQSDLQTASHGISINTCDTERIMKPVDQYVSQCISVNNIKLVKGDVNLAVNHLTKNK